MNNLLKSILPLFLWISICTPAISSTPQEMQTNYLEYKALQTEDSLPFLLKSEDARGQINAKVRTFLPDIPFDLLAIRLSDVSEWCEFIPLHLNIKACSYQIQENATTLSFYIGPKGYETPDQVHMLQLGFSAQRSRDFLVVQFDAPTGPFGSSNYDFQFRAIEVDNGVYLEFDLSSRPGFVSRIAKLYFATVGSRKVGFSTNGTDRNGQVRYVKGQRGGAERNIVRYLFSVQAYFRTIDQEQHEDLYQLRLENWFDLTQRHEKQLYELPRMTYLKIKQKERMNQILLLDAIARGIEPNFDTINQRP